MPLRWVQVHTEFWNLFSRSSILAKPHCSCSVSTNGFVNRKNNFSIPYMNGNFSPGYVFPYIAIVHGSANVCPFSRWLKLKGPHIFFPWFHHHCLRKRNLCGWCRKDRNSLLGPKHFDEKEKKRKRKKRKVNVVPSPIDAFVNFSWEFSRLSSRDTHEAKGKNEIVKFVFKGTADVSNGNNLNWSHEEVNVLKAFPILNFWFVMAFVASWTIEWMRP